MPRQKAAGDVAGRLPRAVVEKEMLVEAMGIGE